MAAILVVAVGAAVIVSQRKITAATRDYAARQVAALEEERGRVARELHDDVSQQIAVLSQLLDSIQESSNGGPIHSDHHSAIEAAGDGLQDIAATVRDLAHRMHPSALDHLGLGPALTSLAREVSAGTSLQIEVEIPAPAPELAQSHALALYRVAQEALRNVQKHARATRAVLRIAQTDRRTTLEISDDGVGLPGESTARPVGLGVVSMRERMRLVGGDVSITSSPGQGTSVQAWVPARNGATR